MEDARVTLDPCTDFGRYSAETGTMFDVKTTTITITTTTTTPIPSFLLPITDPSVQRQRGRRKAFRRRGDGGRRHGIHPERRCFPPIQGCLGGGELQRAGTHFLVTGGRVPYNTQGPPPWR